MTPKYINMQVNNPQSKPFSCTSFLDSLSCVANSPFWTVLIFRPSLLILFPLIIQVLLNIIQVLNTACLCRIRVIYTPISACSKSTILKSQCCPGTLIEMNNFSRSKRSLALRRLDHLIILPWLYFPFNISCR